MIRQSAHYLWFLGSHDLRFWAHDIWSGNLIKAFFIESYTYETDFILGTIQKYLFKSPYLALPFFHWYALPVTASKLTITAA